MIAPLIAWLFWVWSGALAFVGLLWVVLEGPWWARGLLVVAVGIATAWRVGAGR